MGKKYKIDFSKEWVNAATSNFSEGKVGNTRNYYIEGLALPFDKVSRNGVLYNKESIVETHKQLVGCSFMHNHVIDGATVLPRGEVTKTWLEEDGLHYKAKIYETPMNVDYLEILKQGGLKKVSIQISGFAESKLDEDGNEYQEAFIKDWIELSSVNAPGFKDTTLHMTLSEALKKKKKVDEEKSKTVDEDEVDKEDVTLGNNGADLTATKIKKKKQEFYKNLLDIRNKL